MNTQDNLNTVNELGRTIALLAAQSGGSTNTNAKIIENLIAALGAKAQELLNPVAITNTSGLDELVIGAGDTAHIHCNGDVELVHSGTIVDMMASPHASDCATNNRGVSELLGPCDCREPKVVKTAARMAYEQAGPTLQSYFEGEMARGVIDFSLRSCRMADGLVGFYLHPQLRSGETAQFTINGNALTTHVAA